MIPKKSLRVFASVAAVCLCMMAGPTAYAEKDKDKEKKNDHSDCKSLPNYAALKGALDTAVQAETSGFNLQMWAAIVNRDGIVCAVAFSGTDRGAQWPGSRVISAQKANTANSFSLDGSSTSKHGDSPAQLTGWPRVVDGQSLLCGSARRQPLWITVEQSSRHRCCLRRPFVEFRDSE